MEGLLDEGLLAQAAADIDHSQVEEVVAVAEIAQVDEIALVAGEDGVAELQVAVDGCILVRGIGDELAYLVLLCRTEERILRNQAVVAILDVLELRGVHLRGV